MISQYIITENPTPCFDSKSTFYYALSLPTVEKMFEQTKANKVPKQKVKGKSNFTIFQDLNFENNFNLEKAPRNRRRKKSEVKIREVQDELEKLTITIKTDGNKKRTVDNDPAALLTKLNSKLETFFQFFFTDENLFISVLQSGKLPSRSSRKQSLRQRPIESRTNEGERGNVGNDSAELLKKLNSEFENF